MANGNLPTDTPYDAASSTSTGRVLSEDAGREMAVQTRSNFAAGIGISGLQIQLMNGQSSPAIIGTATIPTASQSAAGAMASADKAKLDGVAAGANNYVLPSAGKGTLGGVKTTSDVTSAAGYTPAPIIDGVPYYKDTNTTYDDATQSAHGLMTAADKKKLDGVAAGANNYSHPTTPGNKHIPAGGAAGQVLAWASDGTAQWQAEKDTTYGDFKGATTSAAGSRGLVPAPAMGAATRYLRSDGTWQVPPYPTIDSALSPTSANPVPTPTAGSNNAQLATTEFVQNAVNAAITNAAAYQGAANSYTEVIKTAYKPGWYWFVRTAGEYAGQQCESGDMIIANKAKGDSVSDSDFDVIQSNVDYVTANDVKVWFA